MKDWNVVVTVHERGFVRACEILEEQAPVRRAGFYNVLVMKVPDIGAFLDAMAADLARHPEVATIISRIAPAQTAFGFASPEEFEAKAKAATLGWAPRIAGHGFHVRVHRRGFKGRLSTPDEERFLDDALLEAAAAAGAPARMDFADPDLVVAVDTVGDRAGLSLWTRADRERYPFLKPD